MFLGESCLLFPATKRKENKNLSYRGSISILLLRKVIHIYKAAYRGEKKKKLMKAFIFEGQQVSEQSLRAAFDFSQSAARTPASAISIKLSCLAF